MINRKIKKLKKTKWFLPILFGIVLMITLLLFIGVAFVIQHTVPRKKSINSNVIAKSNSEELVIKPDQAGTLYSIAEDDIASEYGSNEALESGYDTDNLGTGKADRLRELQDQLDSISSGDGLNSSEYENDIRGKVDYNTLNSRLKDAEDEIENKIDSIQTSTSTEINTVRTVIATNKTDSDNKISKIKTAVDSNTSKLGSLESKVNTNASNSAAALNDSNKKLTEALNRAKNELSDEDRRTNESLNKAKEELTDADKKTNEALDESNKQMTESLNTAKTDLTGKIDNLGTSLTTTINNNYTSITTGSTAVLIGTYDNSDPTNTKLILQGGK